jgi:5,5'-dehydrodivanillate O-demethylase
MLSAEDNKLLTEVAADTRMGQLLRRYWHPIAASSQLDDKHPTRLIQILGEKLVLYKDKQGRLGLIDERCPHRRASMLYGIPEQEGLRCSYHGWLFNNAGRCLAQPYEQMEDPCSNFKDHVRIKSYPVRELGGLVFAYLGPAPAPELPAWDLLVTENLHRDIGFAVVPCNWLQIMENAADPVHAEWLHGHFANYVWERLGKPERIKPFPTHKKIGFDLSEYGIIKRRVLEGETEEHENWKFGHSLVFPNLQKGGGLQWRVPMDETRTLHVWYYTYTPAEGTVVPKDAPIPVFDVPVPALDEHGHPRWDVLDFTAGQDMVMWYTQGAVAERWKETLGRSDRGVIMYRNLLKANLEKLARGEEPMNVFRDPAKAAFIQLDTEESSGRRLYSDRARQYGPSSSNGPGGGATKYSPVLNLHKGAETVSAKEVMPETAIPAALPNARKESA